MAAPMIGVNSQNRLKIKTDESSFAKDTKPAIKNPKRSKATEPAKNAVVQIAVKSSVFSSGDVIYGADVLLR
jgi:hypothetical protein